MLKYFITFFLVLLISFGCYKPDSGLTENRQVSFVFNDTNFQSDGQSTYDCVINLPGIKFGKPFKVKLQTSWGTWQNDSSVITIQIPYNKTLNTFIDTVKLHAGISSKDFFIEIEYGENIQYTNYFHAKPNYPDEVQLVADSTIMKFLPGNSTPLKAFFFSDTGYVSENIRFRFMSSADVTIFPKEILIENGKAEARLKLNAGISLGNFQVYGFLPSLTDTEQPKFDTLNILVVN